MTQDWHHRAFSVWYSSIAAILIARRANIGAGHQLLPSLSFPLCRQNVGHSFLPIVSIFQLGI